MLAKAGHRALGPFGVTNEETAALLRRYPDRFSGMARISVNAFKGMAGRPRLGTPGRDEGFTLSGVSARWMPSRERSSLLSLYTRRELGIPVRSTLDELQRTTGL